MTQANVSLPPPPIDVFVAKINIFTVIARPGGKILLSVALPQGGQLDIETDPPTADVLALACQAAATQARVAIEDVKADAAPAQPEAARDRGSIEEPVTEREDHGEIDPAPGMIN